MTPTELLDTLCQRQAIPATRIKDFKTSIRYLMKAAEHLGETILDAESLEPRYKTMLRQYFAALNPVPSPHTVRNTLNNLSFLYRTARAHDLIRAIPPRPTRVRFIDAARESRLTSPYRERARLCFAHYRLPVNKWPQTIRKPWLAYRRSKALTTRPITLGAYEGVLKAYVGFGLREDDPPLTTWDQLFETPRLTRFIQWHAARAKVPRITETGIKLVKVIIRLAREANRPEVPALQTFVRTLPRPEPMHNKQHPDHCISLRELEQIGLTLLATARNPLQSPGSKQRSIHRASRHRVALTLRLLVRIPLRARNLSEMRLGHNLYKDHHGIWQLRFQGEELKVSERHGRTNVFHIPFPPDLVEHLKEYIDHYRPILARTPDETHLLLSRWGTPMNVTAITDDLRNQVYFHTNGKRFFTHLIRTIWTDTYLLNTHDVSTAAFMLNDTPETVLGRYHELRANDHIQKANRFLSSLLGTS